LKDTLYTTRLLFTKMSPPTIHGVIPRIGKKKLLEKLQKYGITEEDVDRTRRNGTYAVWVGKDLLLEIRELKH